MLSPFRFFRSRPDNRIRVDEDDTNYENLLSTAVGSDAEDEDVNDFSNNVTSNTQNTAQNQNASNQTSTSQNNNLSFSNNNDIFGDFSHFNNMGNVPTTSAVNLNNTAQTNSINENNDNNKIFDEFNIFSNNENINLFKNNNSNNKRVGSTGDINNLSKNTSNNLRFHDNNLISSISESQIFNKSNETTDILGINNSSTVNSNQTTNNINKNRINDIFGDFANFQNAFSFDQQNSTVNNNNNTNIDNDNDKDTAKIVNFENKNNKEEELKINENNNDNDNNNNSNNNNKIDNKETNISSINEDDNDLFGDFNSHNFNNDNDNIFDNFTPVITENTTNASNDFFNPDFASFTSAFSNTNINNNNTSDTSNIQPPSTSTISINPPPMASSNIIEFDAFNLNSSSPNQKPVSYDLFSTYEPSQNKNINLNNKASFESITNTDITTEYEEELLFNPIMGNDNDNKKENNNNNNKIDKTGKNDSINTTNNDNKNNNNNNNSSSSSSSSNDKNTLITIDDKKLNKKSSKEHNKNQNNILKENKNTNISTPSTPSTPSKQAVIATATSSMNSNFVSSPSRETPKKSENMKVQTPIKLKNSESIKNDHISSSDARMKLGDNKEISTISTPTTTNNNIQKIENILDLPPDIILHILTFVSLEELPKLAQLCHRFKLLVYNDSIYELKLRLLGIDYISTDEWISMNTPKNKQINSELNNNTERNNHSVSNNQSGFSTSTMNIDELNNYLLTGKKSLLNLDNLNKSNKENPSNKEKQQNNDNKIKDNKKKNEINIFAKDNDRYKISEDFNIFAKEEEYENKNEGMYKLGSNESVDILNIEGPDQNEAELKKEEDKEKDVEITKKDKNKDQLTVDTELNNNDNENDQKEKIVSTQTKLQMSFKKTPREVFKKECKEILQYYLDFKHPVPYKYLIFEDYTNIYDIAKILHRLVKFSKGRFVTEWQTIQNNINTTVADFEDLLQSEFEENYNELDIENLSNIAKAYQELNGGAPLVQYYLSKCQLFYDPKFNFASLAIYKNNISHPSLSSTELQPGGVIALGSDEEIPEPKSPLDEGNDLIVQYTSFINRLISVIRDQFYQIKQIFPYESDALFLFLQRVVDDIISDYLNTTIEHARRLDPSYYITLFSTFLFTTINIVEVIDSWDKEYEKEHPHKGSKFSSQALKGELQSVMEPFTSYTIQDEVDVLKKQYKEEIDKWKTEREKRKKAETGFLDGDVESYKRNVMNTFKSVLLAPAVMTKNLMGKNKKAEASKEKKVHLDDNTITDSLSLELSLNLIHMNKEALKRCQSIMEIMNEDIGKCAEKLFIVLIKYLDSEHIAPSFQLATKQLATNENHGTKNIIHSLVTFFELIHIADLIQQMVHVYYMEDIAKYVDENDFMSEIIVEKKQFERHLDDLVAQGMDKSIQVLIDNIEYTLINELPLDAYNIQSEHQVMDLKPTPTCLKVVEFLSYHSKMIIGVTDKNTINVLYEEISIRLFNIFVKNLKRMQINLLGAGQLICDLNQYCIWASTLRNPATTKIFSVLKEVGNLFIVDTPQDLKRIVLDTDRYGGYLRRDDIDELLKCRTDYKEIQHVIETKDCIIQ